MYRSVITSLLYKYYIIVFLASLKKMSKHPVKHVGKGRALTVFVYLSDDGEDYGALIVRGNLGETGVVVQSEGGRLAADKHQECSVYASEDQLEVQCGSTRIVIEGKGKGNDKDFCCVHGKMEISTIGA